MVHPSVAGRLQTADDTPQVSSDKVNLTLSVATTLSGNAKSRVDLPEAEKYIRCVSLFLMKMGLSTMSWFMIMQ